MQMQRQGKIGADVQIDSIYDVLAKCDLRPRERDSKYSVVLVLIPAMIIFLILITALICKSIHNSVWFRAIALIAIASAMIAYCAGMLRQYALSKRRKNTGEELRIHAEHDVSNVARLAYFSRGELEDAQAAIRLTIVKSSGISDFSIFSGLIAAISVFSTALLDSLKPEGPYLSYVVIVIISAVLSSLAMWVSASRSSLRAHYYLSLLELALNRFQKR
ncbi:hypothetical protein AWB77_00683 [Caballeronia fortuita]|uniref:Uncharacterized protein n=1 Tax=Caballeronia fortuita TaxID=1777138 RepID=A0A157ZF49_9BURK|nr:hypothetical protein [Caballeronia fortuita]SAK44164.1 hypothetical protein AWB77_00683 [Caballeronia fortuita]